MLRGDDSHVNVADVGGVPQVPAGVRCGPERHGKVLHKSHSQVSDRAGVPHVRCEQTLGVRAVGSPAPMPIILSKKP
jgi:hypothetical protein